MRCKKHLTDLSSTVGVCASCLRERLFILVAAQIQAQAHAQEDRRKSDSHLSPYIIRQKSACNHHHNHRQSLKDQLFFSTPQVGPPRRANEEPETREKEGSTRTRFSLFSRFLFRSKPKKTDSDLNSVSSCTASTSTGSWFSNMLSGHRKKQSATEIVGRTGRNLDRGMSPARVSDYGGHETEWFEGVSSGYSSSSASQSWWHTPRRAAATAKRRGGVGGRLSQSRSNNMTFCLSPLVRASPCRQWSQKGVTPEMAFSGEISLPVNLSTAASFCANRSRKLADFGRFNHNH
ncbi:hypothetical protein Vadar_000607 [Vaccinium darrowii]|uniref:Uncharacterized protein n=1 Tax=Vaccinium darrowii TaxID=229202 RepID=A0ACB7Y5D6_9ERIC|nr:hypothetical protein Vadar_000607 [Vaccinium darrowii]